MNAAAILALCAAVLQLGMGLLLVGLARAPGWRAARTFAVLALTAFAYSSCNVFFALPGASDQIVLAASRINYCMASVHVTAWMLYTHGGPTASPHRLPIALKVLAAVLTGTGLFILFTGLHSQPGAWNDTSIDWAHIAYHSPKARPWAEWYGLVMVGSLLVPFVAFARRARDGEQGAIAHLIGFSVFFACSTTEVLVANGTINTFYMADLGFLAVVVPVAVATVRRVVADAGRLNALSQRLAGEVEERTVALDRAQLALIEAERHAALGRLAAGVGHEINNPLTYLGLSLESLEEWAQTAKLGKDQYDALASARDGTDRIRQVVDGLRSYTRTTSGEDRLLKPEELVRNALRVASHQLQHVARIVADIGETPHIFGDEARLVQVLVNLLTNAAQAIAEAGLSGDVTITARTRCLDDGTVAMEVVDNGPGISPENLRHLAQPYFTTRAANGGTGLGLFLARGIMEQHGGRFEIDSELGRGTTARAVLPAASAPDLAMETVAVDAEPLSVVPSATDGGAVQHAKRRIQVLVVDDEPLLARVLARTLTSFCDVVIANSGLDALEKLAAHPQTDAILCDLMMPGMSGIELADVLAVRHPALRRRTLFMTGGAVTPAATEFLERPDVRYMSKPVAAQELMNAVKRLASDSVA